MSEEKIKNEHQWEYLNKFSRQRRCEVCTLWEGEYSRSIPCEGQPHVCSVESGCFPAREASAAEGGA